MLIKLQLVCRRLDPLSKVPLKLYGQELTGSSYAIACMNRIIHDMQGEVVRGDSMRNPKFKDGDTRLKKFDIVVANPMWNQPFDPDVFENDPFERFEELGGNTSGKGDWAWLQHTLAALKDTGRAAIVLDTGAATRGSGSKNEDKERNIRKTTLFLVPKALHIHLWIQFWNHYGSGLNVQALLNEMPQTLFGWFTEMFKYGHQSPTCLTQIEKLTGKGGPFDNHKFIFEGPGAVFLNELAEAHPEATLRCIERTVGSWKREELLRFSRHRQYVVWALQKIAIWKDLFGRAATVLLKLACAENATNSNNSTGVYAELFGMGFQDFATSEAPPDLRLPFLKAALTSTDSVARKIGLKAAGHALADHPHVSWGGPQHQGIRATPKLWSPKLWSEVFDAYRASLGVVMEHWRAATGEERKAAAETIIDACRWMVRGRPLEKDVLRILNELIADPSTDLRLVVQMLAQLRLFKWQGVSGSMRTALRNLDLKITGTSLESQIRRLVLLGSFEDVDRATSGPYGAKHTASLAALAKKLLKKPALLKRLLPRFCSENGFAIGGFGRALGDADKDFKWHTEIIETLRKAKPQNPELVTGYLGAMFKRDVVRWEAAAGSVLKDKQLRQLARPLILHSGMTEKVLDAICDGIERKRVPANAVQGLGLARGWYGLPDARFKKFIEWCLRQRSDELTKNALDTANHVYCFGQNPAPMPEQPILKLLTAKAALEQNQGQKFDYDWSELVKRLVGLYPHRALTILDSVLKRFDTWQFSLSFQHSLCQNAVLDILRADPIGSWKTIAQHVQSVDTKKARNILSWLGSKPAFGRAVEGPLSLLPATEILKWISGNPKKRAYIIARECPHTVLVTEGGTLTREILIRYGDQDEVRSALWANFGSEGWSGPASEHHRRKRDMLREWLAKETAPAVMKWLQEYIDYLGRRIKDEEIQEEREF